MDARFAGGTLACGTDCTFDTSRCLAPTECGDGVRGPGEACDGADLGGADCESTGGFAGGRLACGPDCVSYDTGGCFKLATCGDRVVDAGEECDGSNLEGVSCADLGFDGGALSCSAGCLLDTSGCHACGNGIREGGEACDRDDVGGADCTSISQGYIGGSLGCNAYCAFLDTSGCTPPPGCGDGVIAPSEECDGANVAGATCEGEGYIGGVMDCAGGCVLDRSACTGRPINRDFNGDGYDDLVVGAFDAPLGAGPTGEAYVFFGGPGAFDAVADGTLVGAGTYEQFGSSVAAAGDLNGDGFGDVVVGAGNSSVDLVQGGRAYVYFGGSGSSFDTVPDGILSGLVLYGGLGRAVAAAGDVNGDGFGDLIVGAPNVRDGLYPSGRAYVFFGGLGPTFDTTADLTFAGAGSMELGHTVAAASDVNGDGYDDIVVGSRLGEEARVYFGGPAMLLDDLPDAVLTDPNAATTPDDSFGQAVASAGDVDGDGFADIVVGALQDDAGGVDAGAVYLYRGGPGAAFDASADAVLTGSVLGGRLGGALGGRGDVDGDGYDDVGVGAPGAQHAYLFRGGPGGLDPAPDADIDGLPGPGPVAPYFASSVSMADFNGDGFADLVVGAQGSGASGPADTTPGTVNLYFGAPGVTFATVAAATLTSQYPGDQFGLSVGCAGDQPQDHVRVALLSRRIRRRLRKSG
ncbi:MAG TPA: FG-GAP-like repeat-containing protein [Myxococcota bacterium]|nr:FG-GAP-like repeat-containing protein [Myxococcota bacterium]